MLKHTHWRVLFCQCVQCSNKEQLRNQTAWTQAPVLSLTSYVNTVKLVTSLNFSFLICKLQLTGPTFRSVIGKKK